MENQNQKISGYRDLSEDEIMIINRIKESSEIIGIQVQSLREDPRFDQRWINIGATHLQEGFMALVRAIAQPTTF